MKFPTLAASLTLMVATRVAAFQQAPAFAVTKSFTTSTRSAAPVTTHLKAISDVRKEEIDSAIKDNDVVIFSKTFCPFCKKTKALFIDGVEKTLKGPKPIIFELDELDDGADIQDYLLEKTDQKNRP